MDQDAGGRPLLAVLLVQCRSVGRAAGWWGTGHAAAAQREVPAGAQEGTGDPPGSVPREDSQP